MEMMFKISVGDVEFQSDVELIEIYLIDMVQEKSNPVTIYLKNGVSIDTDTESEFYKELEKLIEQNRTNKQTNKRITKQL